MKVSFAFTELKEHDRCALVCLLPRIKRPLLRAALALMSMALAGCAGYHLGPTNGLRAGARTIQINPFSNQASEPRLSEAVTASLRKNLQQDGTYRLGTRDDGDIILTGTILNLDRTQLSFQPNDILTARDYKLAVTAQVTARERNSGKVILDRKVGGHTTVRTFADQTSAEREAIPLVADDLARNITGLLVDGTW